MSFMMFLNTLVFFLSLTDVNFFFFFHIIHLFSFSPGHRSRLHRFPHLKKCLSVSFLHIPVSSAPSCSSLSSCLYLLYFFSLRLHSFTRLLPFLRATSSISIYCVCRLSSHSATQGYASRRNPALARLLSRLNATVLPPSRLEPLSVASLSFSHLEGLPRSAEALFGDIYRRRH